MGTTALARIGAAPLGSDRMALPSSAQLSSAPLRLSPRSSAAVSTARVGSTFRLPAATAATCSIAHSTPLHSTSSDPLTASTRVPVPLPPSP